MATNAVNRMILHLRRAALLHEGSGLTDGDLLECYVSRRDEAAFEALVRRHGPMVLGVCRRILRNEADAEDAFQASFLVLVRKASSIQPRGQVSNWLYGVAHNTALKARAMIRKRRIKEWEAGTVPKPEVAKEVSQQAQVMLDTELSQLPDKYRVPIVLCELEGKTIKEAARHLGWPQGTVATRLARGRVLLAKQLSKHGLDLSGGVLAALLSQNGASACVPTSLVSSTVKAATVVAAGGAAASVVSARVAALAEGVLKAMLLTNLKTATSLALVISLLAGGAAVLLQRTVVAQETVDQRPVQVVEQPRAKEPGQSAPGVLKTEGAVWRMAWSTNGKTLVTASIKREEIEVDVDGQKEKLKVENTTVQAWDARTRKLIVSFGEEKKTHVESLVCSPDGKTAVIAVERYDESSPSKGKNEVRVLDTEKGTLETIEELEGLRVAAFSPDGKSLASGGTLHGLPGDPIERVIKFWDVQKGKVTTDIKEKLEFDKFNGKSAVCSLLYSPDGKYLAAAYQDGKIVLWDTKTGKPKETLETELDVTVGTKEFIWGMAFSPDAKALAVAGNQETLKLFDTHSGKEKQTLKGVGGNLLSLAFSPDGRLLATGLGKGECILWEVQTSAQKRTLRDLQGPVTGVAFSPDGKTLATGVARLGTDNRNDLVGGEVKLWALKDLLD